MVFLSGLGLAPVSHGAVLNPGVVPFVVFFGSIYWGERSFCKASFFSLLLIIAGLALVTATSFSAQGDALLGDALILAGGLSWGVFTLLDKKMECGCRPVGHHHSIPLRLVPTALSPLFPIDPLPVSWIHLVLQGAFQGLFVSLASVYLVVYGIQALGPQRASLFSPLVPLLATLAAIPSLGEIPTRPNGSVSSSSSWVFSVS